MSAVFFQFPSQEAFRTHATEWSAETTENGFKILLQTVSELCTLYNTYVFLMPYLHLPFRHTRKISQHTVFLFNFTLCTRKKKVCIFHQRSRRIHLDRNLSSLPLFRLNTILITNLETLVWFSPSPILV